MFLLFMPVGIILTMLRLVGAISWHPPLVLCVIGLIGEVGERLWSWYCINANNKKQQAAPTAPRTLLPNLVLCSDSLRFIQCVVMWLWRILVTAPISTLYYYLLPSARIPLLEDDVVAFLLTGSYCIYTKVEGDDEITLNLKGFASPFRVDQFDSSLFVRANHRQRKILDFRFCGIQIVAVPEMITILSNVFTTCVHPVVHSFHNKVYQSRNAAGSKFREMFLHGQDLNFIAGTLPGIVQNGTLGSSWFWTCLIHNAATGFPLHRSVTLKVFSH